MDETDLQLQLKKRARRRLVGAAAFVSIAAVILPTVMDHDPRPVVQDVEIRIPGQDEKPFTPRLTAENTKKNASPTTEVVLPPVEPDSSDTNKPVLDVKTAPLPSAVVQETSRRAERSEKLAEEKSLPKLDDKSSEKGMDKSKSDKAALDKVKEEKQKDEQKVREKTQQAEAKRAAAILGGQSDAATSSVPLKAGSYQILIGAFANEGNVKIIKSKLAEMDIKVMTEILDTPQGKKTRVRAGPFANKEAADKALVKMQKIGVSGVVAAK